MSHRCFICGEATYDYKEHQVDYNTQKLSPVCDNCSNFPLDYCDECKKLKKSENLRNNIEGKNLCDLCLPGGSKICKECDLLALFKCSCNFYLCKFCAENHFIEVYNKNLANLKNGQWNRHLFSSYPTLKNPLRLKDYFAPDFRSFFLKNSLKHINSNTQLSKIFEPIERMCDYYKQSIKFFEKILNNDLKIAEIYFASGYYSKFCEYYKKVIQSPQSQKNPESWLKLAPFYYHLSHDENAKQQLQDFIKQNSNSISSKILKKMLLAWTSYLNKKNIKKLGKFFKKCQFIKASKEKLIIFTLAGLITNIPGKLENIIDHLNFYYQETPEHSLMYSRLASLLNQHENYSKISFQIIIRYSGYDNLDCIKYALDYFRLKVPDNGKEAENLFLNLFQETFIAGDSKCLDHLKQNINVFIKDSKKVDYLKNLDVQ